MTSRATVAWAERKVPAMAKATTKTPTTRSGSTLSKREEVAKAFAQLVYQVPEADPGDVTDLLGPILAATSWEDLQESDGIPSSKTLALTGHKIRVDSIARKPSDKPSLTGFYLLCDGVDIDSGEMIRFTAGGAQAVAVLSRLYVLGSLPAYVRFESVGTNSGNDAINCTVLGVNPSLVIDG